MFKNYFKTAIRFLFKRKSYALLNILGLSLGLLCSMLILLYVLEEYSVNLQFSNAEQIYRVNTRWADDNQVRPLSMAPLANVLPETYPDIKNAARYTAIDITLSANNELFRESLVIGSPSLFEVFDFKFLYGEGAASLENPYSVVITETMAERFFGEQDVVGETIAINTWDEEGRKEFTVTGVINDPEYNSITNFNGSDYGIFVSFLNVNDFYADASFDDWTNYNCLTYLKLTEDSDVAALTAQFSGFLQQYLPDGKQQKVSLELEPLTEIYLNEAGGAARELSKLLLVLAFLILLLAVINYVNFATSRASNRAKEVGIRKVIGAEHRQLMSQYIGESMIITALSMGISLIALLLLTDLFSAFSGRSISLDIYNPLFLGMIIGLVFITGLSAGLYPAIVLSKFKPAQALKGKIASRSKFSLRKLLVVTQFTIAVALLSSVLIISKQVEFMTDQDPGFHKEQVVVISSLPREWNEEGVKKLDLIKSRIERIPGVESASIGWGPPGRYTGISADFTPAGAASQSSINMPVSQVDADYLDVLDIHLLEGRFFRKEQDENESVVVINESAARALGWESIQGKQLKMGENTLNVIGLVEDYHVSSFHQSIPPLVLADVRQWPLYRDMSIRLTGEGISSSMERIRETWEEIYPDIVFETYFLDQFWASQYEREEKVKQIAGMGSVLALLIAALGLLGLISVNVIQRSKEIGIRKVLGASVKQIVTLLTWDSIKPVLISLLIAIPLTWFFMNRWLQDFAYRVEIEANVFLLAGALITILAFLTTGWHSVKAAFMNPVDSLRNE